ncbi:hypothetical protein LMTR13_27330 [Bradyrhizobium icense]|uniref:Uncharacterized protein n=1 Tax=Bradyrhizobium icense TaxID=1274631 RepID=A0A1B1UKK6_9BRAD|nr:hypothetical protein LMTR13_27330 [Bradyrhizobium icense]
MGGSKVQGRKADENRTTECAKRYGNLHWIGVFVDEQFLKDRAQIIRDLADKADPFTRKRLLDLAERYDRRMRPTVSDDKARPN